MKKYHKENAEQDHLIIAETNSSARHLFDEIENNWKPGIENAVKVKDWEVATNMLLNMPYRRMDYFSVIFDRKITDKEVIKKEGETDKFVESICQKIPVKIFKKTVHAYHQEKINEVRRKASNVTNIVSDKFNDDRIFSIDNLPDHLFLREEKRSIEDCMHQINKIGSEYSDFLELAERNNERDKN